MEDELRRQEEEKREIESRLKEKLRKQQEQEEQKMTELKVDKDALGEQFNDAPTYYQPTIVP